MKPIIKKLIIHIDGASQGNPGPSGIGITFESMTGEKLFEISNFIGYKTNNQAEYEALITALKNLQKKHTNRRPPKAIADGGWSLTQNSEIIIRTDSELLCNQVNGLYKVRDWSLRKLHSEVIKLIKELPKINLTLIPREENRNCDRLAKKAIREMIKSGVVSKATKTTKAQSLFSQ